MWMIQNPRRGVCVPDDLPHEYVLKIAKPYLGKWISVPEDWTPLKHYRSHFAGHNRPAIDPSDPWQFTNFLLTDSD
jgi:homospermidine synthase